LQGGIEIKVRSGPMPETPTGGAFQRTKRKKYELLRTGFGVQSLLKRE